MQQAEGMSDSRIDWRREYEETLAAVQMGDDGRGDGRGSGEAEGEPLVMAAPVERFLDRILLAASEHPNGEKSSPTAPTAKASEATITIESSVLRKRLAVIGRTLRPMLSKQESAVTAAAKAKAQPQSTGTKNARAGLLQLELVVRAITYGGVKGKSAKKTARSEIRGLLDRIALLLDAANPASIAGDDGRSPFQELLEGVLASRLEKPLPQLVRYLFKAYEFLEEESADAPANDTLPGLNVVATGPAVQSSLEGDKSSIVASLSADAANQSILSVLMEERSKKRSRDEIGDTFKEMLLPQELQQLRQKQRRHHHSDKSRRESSSTSSSTGKRHKSSSSRSTKSSSEISVASVGTATASIAVPAISGIGALSVRRTISLDAALRSAGTRTLPTRRSLPSNFSFASPIGISMAAQSRHSQSLLAATPRLGSPPLLQAHAGRTVSSLGRLSQSTAPTQPQTSRPVASTASATAAAAVPRQLGAVRGTVVMRTPDRPRRQPARTMASSSSSSARVLVAASPPLRRPRPGAQQQLRKQNAQPLLGGSAARRQQSRAPPPPLFQ